MCQNMDTLDAELGRFIRYEIYRGSQKFVKRRALFLYSAYVFLSLGRCFYVSKIRPSTLGWNCTVTVLAVMDAHPYSPARVPSQNKSSATTLLLNDLNMFHLLVQDLLSMR